MWEEYEALKDAATAASGFLRLADVEERSIERLWPGRMAWDYVVLVAGDGGVGEITLTQNIASVSRGGESIMGGEVWRS